MEEVDLQTFSDSDYELQEIDDNFLLDKLNKEYCTDNQVEINKKTDTKKVIFSAGGPNIKINPLYGNIYYLNSTKGTFILLDNNDKHNRLTIKAECWKLSNELIETNLERYIKNKSNKVERYLNVFKNCIYFRYIQISYKNSSIIVDLKDMGFREYSNSQDLKDYNLPSINLEDEYEDFEVSKKSSSNIGLVIGAETTKAVKIVQRYIKIKNFEGDITIRLARDRKHIINRNCISIEASESINWYNYSGLLIREAIIFSEPDNTTFCKLYT